MDKDDVMQSKVVNFVESEFRGESLCSSGAFAISQHGPCFNACVFVFACLCICACGWV